MFDTVVNIEHSACQQLPKLLFATVEASVSNPRIFNLLYRLNTYYYSSALLVLSAFPHEKKPNSILLTSHLILKRFLFSAQSIMAFPTNVVSCTSDDVFNNVDTVLNESSAQGRCELLKAQEDRYAKRCYSFCDFTESITFSMGAPGECVSAVQGKKGVWIKVPTEQARLVPIAIDAGFLYHRAEPSYVMLVYWILQTPSTIPDNASHQVGIAAFLFNDKGEVLVVQEKCGLFKISGLWKMPTGRTNQGEGIKEGAIGEVQEETGWMAVEEFASQPKNQQSKLLKDMIGACVATMDRRGKGFSCIEMLSNSRKSSAFYCNVTNTE
ncbi:hypothetical protein SUGI_0709040 [Cryptomeria japonica]|nr:hypothetical protein SUGI_0709040 [Cryptomeria japonica]